MLKLTYDICLNIAQEALKKGTKLGLNPLAVVVLDDRASLRVCLNQDGKLNIDELLNWIFSGSKRADKARSLLLTLYW